MRASMSGRVSISYVWIGVRLWLVRSSVRPCVRSSGLVICVFLRCVANVSVCLFVFFYMIADMFIICLVVCVDVCLRQFSCRPYL